MNSLRILTLAGGCISVAALILGACSSDTVVVFTDGGGEDASPDRSVVDQSSPDTSTDGGTDADADATVNNDGGGDADATTETFTIDSYRTQLANMFCSKLSTCCFGADVDGGAAVDGGTFDRDKCANIYFKAGFDGSNPPVSVDAGANTLKLDQAKAAECIAKVSALGCNPSGVDYQLARSACFGAVTGKQAAGQPCSDSVECAPGNFCNTSNNGGTCEGVRAVDGPCGDWTTDQELSQHSCSYRFSGEPERFCMFYDFVNGEIPPANWKCKAAVANDQPCANNTWCDNGICDIENDAYVCRAQAKLFVPATCATFVK